MATISPVSMPHGNDNAVLSQAMALRENIQNRRHVALSNWQNTVIAVQAAEAAARPVLGKHTGQVEKVSPDAD